MTTDRALGPQHEKGAAVAVALSTEGSVIAVLESQDS